jgi:putative nucleotidyltransferase with HDIG domain
LAGFLLSGALPYIERLFLVVTDLSLLEWSDRNQPLLRRLALEAPGSFHHSMVVGNLAEAAADAIGGNALLARAGAYMHDVGKLAKPMYFVENIQGQPNPHNSLSPMLSTLIITAHTRDGADIADEYRLPRQIRDIVEQHHGTTCVEYFYNEAVREAERGEEVDRDMFRYRGPKPLSAEAGIVLLADSVESATRSLDDPTPARIQNVVSEIVRRRLMDGQLEESGLTLTDVHRVEQSLVRGLLAHLHHRVKYPDPVETDLEKASRARVS